MTAENRFIEGARWRQPISRMRFHNFKSIADADVTFAPFTLMVGRNSAGKSTLIQAILFLAENPLTATHPAGFRGLGEQSVFHCNGATLELGTYHDLLRKGAPPNQPMTIALSTRTSQRTSPSRNEQQEAQPSLTELTVKYTFEPHPTQEASAHLSNYTLTASRLNLGDLQLEIHMPLDAGGAEVLTGSAPDDSSAEDGPSTGILSRVTGTATLKGTSPEWATTLPVVRLQGSERLLAVVTAAQYLAFNPDRPGAVWLNQTDNRDILFESESMVEQRIALLMQPYSDEEPDLQRFQQECDADFEQLGPPDGKSFVALLSSMKSWFMRANVDFSHPRAIVDAMAHVWQAALHYVLADHRKDPFQIDLRDPRLQDHLRPFLAQVVNADLGLRDFRHAESLNLSPSHSVGLLASINTPEDRRFQAGGWSTLTGLLSRRINYLGPLRMEPKFGYMRSVVASNHAPLGVRGEGAVKLLAERGSMRDHYILPPGETDSGRRQLVSLSSAVNAWLGYFFDRESNLKVHPSTQFGYLAEFEGHALPHVGTGVSQLLPIILLCLMTRPGDVVLLEQPELHLHPSLQQTLTEFLLIMAESGTQILAETHSEYMITRLRKIAVLEPQRRQQFGILFAENEEGTGTTYRNIEISHTGTIEDWPRGFFEEVSNDLDAILQASLDMERE